MKKYFVMILLAVALAGCAYNKQTLLKLKGDEVKVPLGPLESIEGKGLKATLYRNVSIAFPGKEAVKEFKNIKSIDKTSADSFDETVEVQ